MARQTKAQQAERAEAIEKLREWIKPGDTVYTILDHVSSSGMMRAIRVGLLDCEDGRPINRHPNHAVGLALGLKHWKRNGREQDALVVGGAGMDMGFHLVYSLSHTLYPEYPCLGKGKCPSNYHVNHRDRVRCEGVELGRDAEGDLQRRRCYRPDAYNGRWEVPEDWPRSAPYDVGEGQTIRGHLLACLEGSGEEGKPYEVCPTCGGAGDVPNPDGPERFDLVHTDGYALRHRWL